jgi:hypothetical protein
LRFARSDSDVDEDNEWAAASEPARPAEDEGELVADSSTGMGGEEGGFFQNNVSETKRTRTPTN